MEEREGGRDGEVNGNLSTEGLHNAHTPPTREREGVVDGGRKKGEQHDTVERN